LRVFGPGAIIASVRVGTGETIFAPRVGAVFGYAMLWVVLAAVVFKAVQVYAGARYIVLTGASVARLVAYPRAPRMGGQALRLRLDHSFPDVDGRTV
jgi:Mn2+/Fe2+ NRAMP family transporter